LFYAGLTDTDAYVEHKLRADERRLMSWTEYSLSKLKEYSFINGWITATVVGTACLAGLFFGRF